MFLSLISAYGCGRQENMHDVSNQSNKVAAPAEAWKNTSEQILFFSAAPVGMS